MLVCKICGESKEQKEFSKLKYFYKYHKSEAQWCKMCQKMFLEMKKEEERKENFLQIPFVARVEFN